MENRIICQCPACGARFKVSPEQVAKQRICPKCEGAALVPVTENGSVPVPADCHGEEQSTEGVAPSTEQREAAETHKECPHCAKPILNSATRCEHCGKLCDASAQEVQGYQRVMAWAARSGHVLAGGVRYLFRSKRRAALAGAIVLVASLLYCVFGTNLIIEETPTVKDYTSDSSNQDIVNLAKEGTERQIKDAIKKGLDVNAVIDGETFLWLGAENKRPGVISALIHSGADINAKGDEGNTPLGHAAAMNSNSEAISVFIKAGADVNAKSISGYTPLFYAAEKNPNPRIIKTLANGGANVNVKDIAGCAPIFYAASKNPNPEVITALSIAGADVNAKNNNGETPIFYAAAANSNPEAITALVRAGADINAKKKNGCTSLHLAATSNSNPKVIAELVKHGVDVNERDNVGHAPIHCAASENTNPEIITTLVSSGAFVNATDDNDLTALHYAAGNNRIPDVAIALIKAGANMAANGCKLTPLGMAKAFKNSAVAKVLIHAGAPD